MALTKTKWPKVIGTAVPIYGGTIVLCKSKSEYEQAESYLKVHDESRELPNGGVCQTLINERGNRMYLVGVFDKSSATLAHELAHACFFICRDVGIPTPAGDANEAFCYLLGYLMIELMPHLRGKK
jgi:hypothetical protein